MLFLSITLASNALIEAALHKHIRNAIGVGMALKQLVHGVAQGQITPDESELIACVLKIRAGKLHDEDLEGQVDLQFPSFAIR